MSISDETVNTPDFEVVDAPAETPTEDPNETFILHRRPDGTEKRMPMTEWPAYAKEYDL